MSSVSVKGSVRYSTKMKILPFIFAFILTVNALSVANGVLIPVQCEFFALQGLSELMTTIETIQIIK